MKRYFAIWTIALLCATCMCSCDPENNFFYRPVTFKGDIKEPKLVVTGVLHAGKKPTIYVNQSVFFTEDKRDSMWVDYPDYWEESGEYVPYENRHYLSDAAVEMQVNGGEWQALSVVTVRNDEYYPPVISYYYTNEHRFAEGERVTIRVQHKDFADIATVSQRIPFSPQAAVHFGTYDTTQTTIPFDVDIAAYDGDSTDILRIRAITYTHQCRTRYNNNRPYRTDTLYTQYPNVYSQDIRFAPYDKTNKSLSLNYFGADTLGLYTAMPTQLTRYSMRAAVRKKYYSYNYDYDKTIQTQSYDIDSIVVSIETVSRDEYLNIASMLIARHYYPRVPDYFTEEDSYDDMSDIIENIKDIFDEMGNMEGTQLYDNVDGGIGHVSAVHSQHFCFIPTD